MFSPQLLLLLAACLSSVSAYTTTSSYYYYDDSAIVTYGSIAAIISMILGLWVTFSGLKSMRMSFFLAALTVFGTVTAFTGSNIVISIIVLVLALVVALVKSLYKVGIFLVGMTTGLISVGLLTIVLSLILASTLYSDGAIWTFLAVCGILALILAIVFGVRALNLDPRFLRIATSMLGGFTVSTAVAALIAVNARYASPLFLLVTSSFGGFLVFGLGLCAQKLESYKNPYLAEPVFGTPIVEVVTPAKGQEPYVSAV